jgi:hypothetical protein
VVVRHFAVLPHHPSGAIAVGIGIDIAIDRDREYC